jgi:hypothetical protein
MEWMQCEWPLSVKELSRPPKNHLYRDSRYHHAIPASKNPDLGIMEYGAASVEKDEYADSEQLILDFPSSESGHNP